MRLELFEEKEEIEEKLNNAEFKLEELGSLQERMDALEKEKEELLRKIDSLENMKQTPNEEPTDSSNMDEMKAQLSELESWVEELQKENLSLS